MEMSASCLEVPQIAPQVAPQVMLQEEKVLPLNYAKAVKANAGNQVERQGIGAGVCPGTSWRRNAVCLRWVGEGLPPDTRIVMDKVLEMGFTAENLNCFFHNAVLRDYSISFLRPQELDKFWSSFKQMELVSSFAGFEAVAVSRPSVVKVNIILENESIPPSDLKVWLIRYGKVVEELEKDFGYKGVWTGGWWHGCASSVLKCAMCLDVGHVAKTCPKSKRCNLCGELGHAYGSCPSSWHKIDEEFRAQGHDAQMEDIDRSVEVVEETQLSLESGVPQRGSGGGSQIGRPVPQWKGGPQGLSRSGRSRSEVNKENKKVAGKPGSFPGSFPVANSQSKERIRRGERNAKIPLGDWVRVKKKGSLDPLKGDEACRRREAASSIDTSNRYGLLSWGERVEIEEEGQGEIQEELRRIGMDDVNSCVRVSSDSEFEDIDPMVAEGMPSGMSAKRECSEDDRRTKRRVEAAVS
ncbi:hypothetical protein XELAEV_18002982mg [Xenopus laevis]|nr:hypothetical protein XELAEV_18002982mg [Xenopus laevis]